MSIDDSKRLDDAWQAVRQIVVAGKRDYGLHLYGAASIESGNQVAIHIICPNMGRLMDGKRPAVEIGEGVRPYMDLYISQQFCNFDKDEALSHLLAALRSAIRNAEAVPLRVESDSLNGQEAISEPCTPKGGLINGD